MSGIKLDLEPITQADFWYTKEALLKSLIFCIIQSEMLTF